ncbi:MAG: hypothetical protein JXR37_26520 [Kiritimatiellae bacterium]|nr:hypothetical protein [Kiritimatiellia bacterium]
MRCEYLDICPFAGGKMPCDGALLAIYRKHYCLGEYHNCARHLLYAGLGERVLAPHVYPNQHDRARELLGQASQRRTAVLV